MIINGLNLSSYQIERQKHIVECLINGFIESFDGKKIPQQSQDILNKMVLSYDLL